MLTLDQFMRDSQARVEHLLDTTLSAHHVNSSTLLSAMRYSALDGGKRLRPMLAYATAITLGKPLECADVPACALELIHVYSLIHDDLPAMDDDDLRRGKPTCHKAFNEALAILAGDGLHTLAFQLLASSTQLSVSDNTRIKMITALSIATGAAGMVAGQAIDLDSVGKKLALSELENMHLHKTGALIRASVKLGALAAANATDQQLAALDKYAHYIGLAFQVQDDILDIESSTETLGKKQGADAARNKPTYPTLLGMDNAKKKLKDLIDQAINALTIFDNAALLKALADYIRKRAY